MNYKDAYHQDKILYPNCYYNEREWLLDNFFTYEGREYGWSRGELLSIYNQGLTLEEILEKRTLHQRITQEDNTNYPDLMEVLNGYNLPWFGVNPPHTVASLKEAWAAKVKEPVINPETRTLELIKDTWIIVNIPDNIKPDWLLAARRAWDFALGCEPNKANDGFLKTIGRRLNLLEEALALDVVVSLNTEGK